MRTVTFRPVESYRRRRGYTLIAGIDEVGRGAVAGPLVAAAVILKPYVRLPGLNDSKSLTARQRQIIAKKILLAVIACGYGTVTPREIDALGIARANDVAFARALDALAPRPHYVLADYFSLYDYRCPVEGVMGGDREVRVIAAASVVAKVYRDELMHRADARYPGYGFAEHVGYGTAAHRRAVRRLGLSPLHRRSFAFL